MRKNKILALMLFSIIFLSTSVAIAQVSPQMNLIATETINTPNLSIQSMIPYDNGVVIVMSYVNFSITPGGFNQKPSTVLYIYFFNSTMHLLLYEATLTSISVVIPFIKNGELYIVIDSSSSYLNQEQVESYVYVFNGLKLVNTYTINGLLLNYGKEYGLPPFNLSFPQIIKLNTSSPMRFSMSTIILLNNTNITLVNQYPFTEIQLPQGILLLSENLSNFYSFGPSKLLLFNITMFNYNGKIIWSENITLYNPLLLGTFVFGSLSTIANSNLYTLMGQAYTTVVGDQIFIINTTPIPLFTSSPVIKVNVTILGVNLNNGKITTRLQLYNIIPNIALLNLGGKLYVVIGGEKSVTIEMYNGTNLTTVAKIPLTVKVEQVTEQVPVTNNGQVQIQNVTRNETFILSGFFYDYGKYLLITNPTSKGTNVTDLYYGGITNYALAENVSNYEITPENYVLLLNESDNFSLIFLNNNGTVRGSVNVGQLGISSIFGIISSPNIRVIEVSPYTYYMVKAYYNVSMTSTTSTKGNTELQVYEVNFPKPSPPIVTTTSQTTTSAHMSSSSLSIPTTLVVGIIVVVVIVAAVLFIVFKRQK
ncbi:hypothetical protein [Sulfurisphaera ohwakuensis]|uniref:Uncharacterized protein n=1 Tax=Sulfurisphaera ohwakuensis TaxID=69656 RepID=A0A650CFW0_SULOH|nr:hypothetical protein [Sulfurisphaera ohwakuensis]MBB5254103.1 hypothetical protein [Sulfurisphaera ohwakuensis]QGR16692.1 hypothetical protein D1869_05450 [Sulfurisphaera ohwakuensis]